MKLLIQYLSAEKQEELDNAEIAFQEAITIEEANRLYNQYHSIMDNAKRASSHCVNDNLTKDEKKVIQEYEVSMHRAWTKKGVDKYYIKIMSILEDAKNR
ncbi:hypothetical protein [Alkalibacillus haloalkaliphilus]|uniref:Uncharacterized protein n=1 Tax=Alkalibacillus haloalkaliphilus TaxID=94136 RepID=A0A511W6K5_9BACI|nr:hypothetical protein [Alkalibacillus haloalkaliphilus]GEN46729.1 hypothetical protein AHA02nite_25050 [Alkalibacillus haloalkaliphilus]